VRLRGVLLDLSGDARTRRLPRRKSPGSPGAHAMTDLATTCWSCGKPRGPADALCLSCGKVQPPQPAAAAKDRFATLGLPRAYDLDESALEERYRSLSRKLHPDRFARASPRERRFSLEQTTLLNDAYRTLKDPARRAEHLLELRGVRTFAEGRGAGAVQLPPEFLEETLDDREKLLEAKMEGGPQGVAELAAGVRRKRDEAMAQIGALLRPSDIPQEKLARVADLLARLRYYARYLDEVEGRAPEM
jgi:molecular chaperone HscB